MIKAVIILNSAGKIRLLNFYEKTISVARQQEIVRAIFLAISRRGDELCNFVDNFADWPTPDTRVIYRRYATLCFVFVTDSSESQLAILDLIQVFVEALNRSFESVCELDFIFHSEKVQQALMEMVMGGMVLEMSGAQILGHLSEMSKLTAQSATAAAADGRGGSMDVATTAADVSAAVSSFFSSYIGGSGSSSVRGGGVASGYH